MTSLPNNWNLSTDQFMAEMARLGLITNGVSGGQISSRKAGDPVAALKLLDGRTWNPSGTSGGVRYVDANQQYADYLRNHKLSAFGRSGSGGGDNPFFKAAQDFDSWQTNAEDPYWEVQGDMSALLGQDQTNQQGVFKYRDNGQGQMELLNDPQFWQKQTSADWNKKLGAGLATVVGGGLLANMAGLGAAGASGAAPSIGSGLTAGSGGLGFTGAGSLGMAPSAAGSAAWGGGLGETLAGISTGVGGGAGLLGGISSAAPTAASAAGSPLGGVFSDIAGKVSGGLGSLVGDMSMSDMLKAGIGAAGLIKSGNDTPDYSSLAQQQADAENKMLDAQTLANRPNQTNAAGDTSNWSKDPTSGQWNQDVSFSAANQGKYDAIQAQQAKLMEQIKNQKALAAGPLTSKLDLSGIGSVGTYNPSPYAGGF